MIVIEIAGTYQNCPFHCEVIKINEDFSFEYFRYGDLYGKFDPENGLKGEWNFINSNKIHLEDKNEKLINELNNAKAIDAADSEVNIEPFQPTELNENFIYRKKELCSLDENDKIRFCYKRISKKTSNKLFPKK